MKHFGKLKVHSLDYVILHRLYNLQFDVIFLDEF